MADKSITELPVSQSMTDDALLVVYQNNGTKSIEGAKIKQYARDAAKVYVEGAAESAGQAALSAAAAEGAKTAAEQSAQTAKASEAAAEEIASNAEAAKIAAEAAQAAAQAAQLGAESAKNVAVAAAENAALDAAAETVNSVRGEMQGYLSGAQSAKENAETARAGAESFKFIAEEAKATAETSAQTASGRAVEAAASAQTAATAAGEAVQKAQETTQSAADASVSASSALESKHEAAASAGTAKTEADRAKAEADRATTVVGGDFATREEAQGYADAAEAAAKAASRPSTWTPTAVDIGAVPTARTVNGKALNTNIALTPVDVGALATTGGTMTGAVNMSNNKITNLGTPTVATDAATKGSVDAGLYGKLSLTGGMMTGGLDMGDNDITRVGELRLDFLAANVGSTGIEVDTKVDMVGNALTGLEAPVVSADAANKGYVDTGLNGKLSLTGGAMLGDISMSGKKITQVDSLAVLNIRSADDDYITAEHELVMSAHKISALATPTDAADAATKGYVDTGLNGKLSLSGGTMTGDLNMGNNTLVFNKLETGVDAKVLLSDAQPVLSFEANGPTRKIYLGTNTGPLFELHVNSNTMNMHGTGIQEVGAPTAATDAATKGYVDTGLAGKLSTTGGTVTGNIYLPGNTLFANNVTAPSLYCTNLTADGYIAAGVPEEASGSVRLQSGTDADGAIFITNVSGSGEGILQLFCNPTEDVILRGLAAPVANNDAATKKYVDDHSGGGGGGSGDFKADGSVPMTGNLNMGGKRITNAGDSVFTAVTTNVLTSDSGTVTMDADLNAGEYKITNLATPTADTDAATKKYVDDHSGGGGGAVSSVNGKTGAVVLTPADVGALDTTGGAMTGDIQMDSGRFLKWSSSGTTGIDGDTSILTVKAADILYLEGSFAVDITAPVVNIPNGVLSGLATPSGATDATPKSYVDSKSAGTAYAITIGTADWTGTGPYTFNVPIIGMTATRNGILGLGQGATIAQVDAAIAAKINVTGQTTNQVTMTAFGNKPAVALPMVLTMFN